MNPYSPVNGSSSLTIFLQVALAWVSRTVSSPIVGFNSIERVDQGIVEGELTDEEAEYLEEPYVFRNLALAISSNSSFYQVPTEARSQLEGAARHRQDGRVGRSSDGSGLL